LVNEIQAQGQGRGFHTHTVFYNQVGQFKIVERGFTKRDGSMTYWALARQGCPEVFDALKGDTRAVEVVKHFQSEWTRKQAIDALEFSLYEESREEAFPK
jgi:hypothetical protein